MNYIYALNNTAFPEEIFDQIFEEAKRVGHEIPPFVEGDLSRITRFVSLERSQGGKYWQVRDSLGTMRDRDYEEVTKKFLSNELGEFEEI